MNPPRPLPAAAAPAPGDEPPAPALAEPGRPLRVRELSPAERPQEKLQNRGAEALSDAELLALLLRSGQRGLNVIEISRRIVTEAGSLAGLLRWSLADFRRVRGIGPVKAAQLFTAMELARRALHQKARLEQPRLDEAHVIYEYFAPLAAGLTVEKLWICILDVRHHLIRLVELTSGVATSTLAHPREVFREAVRHGAVSIVLVHNHPSGDPTPSAHDLKVTRELRVASLALQIELLDHVIIGTPARDPAGLGYHSCRVECQL